MLDRPHSYSAAYKKGMVINGINNILLRDAVIITLSLGEQTIFQALIVEGQVRESGVRINVYAWHL